MKRENFRRLVWQYIFAGLVIAICLKPEDQSKIGSTSQSLPTLVSFLFFFLHTYLRTFGGAILTMISSIAAGAFLGYVASMDGTGKELGSRLVKTIATLIAGASLATFQNIILPFLHYRIPKCAEAFALDPYVFCALIMAYFLPAFLLFFPKASILETVSNVIEKFVGFDRLLERPNTATVKSEYLTALNFFHQGKYERTLNTLESYIPAEHEKDACEFARFASLTELGRFEEALAAVDPLVQRDIKTFEPRMSTYLTRCHLGRIDYEKASQTCAAGLKTNPGNKDLVGLSREIEKARPRLGGNGVAKHKGETPHLDESPKPAAATPEA